MSDLDRNNSKSTEQDEFRIVPNDRKLVAIDLNGWKEAFAAFAGAFDTPKAKLVLNDDFTEDVRRRLTRLNEAIETAEKTGHAISPAISGKRCRACDGNGHYLDTTYDRTGVDMFCTHCDGVGEVYDGRDVRTLVARLAAREQDKALPQPAETYEVLDAWLHTLTSASGMVMDTDITRSEKCPFGLRGRDYPVDAYTSAEQLLVKK